MLKIYPPLKQLSVVQKYDEILILASLTTVLIFCILLFLPGSPLLQTVGDYMIMFTHFFILPTIFLAVRTPWLAYIIGLTCALSLLYHFVAIEYNSDVVNKITKTQFQALDESAQTVLVWISTFLFIFDDMPYVGLPFLFLVGLLVAIFGDSDFLFTDWDTFINSVAILCVIIFISYKLVESSCTLESNFFQEKRVWQFVFISLGYFVLAFSFYFLATEMSSYIGEKNVIVYNYLHAGWHVCAYMALFFIFKSRVEKCYTRLNTVRIKRTTFAVTHP